MFPDHTANQAPIALDKFPDLALPALYRAAIGPRQTDYYLKRFTQFESSGKAGLSWNWAAGALTFNWMLFRKLWLPAVIYLLSAVMLPLLLLGVGRLLWHWQPMTETGALMAVIVVFFVAPAVLGNGLYYRQCRAAIERAIQSSPTLEDACQTLAAQASTGQRLQRIAMVNALVLALGAALAFRLLDFSAPQEHADENAPALAGKAASAAAAVTRLPAPAPVSAPENAASSPALSGSAVSPPAAVASGVVATVAPEPVAQPASSPAPMGSVASQPDTEPTLTPPPAPAATAGPAVHGDHYVNIGLFADPDNARRAYVKLIKAGLPASREVLVVRQQKVTRVRSGPYASRKQAQAATARIKALQLDAVLAKR